MAKIDFVAIGNTNGQLGEVYYRTYRGRTLICKKPHKGKQAKNPKHRDHSAIFGGVSQYVSHHRKAINETFATLLNGSALSIFYQCNYAVLRETLTSLLNRGKGIRVIVAAVEDAVAAYATGQSTALPCVNLAGYQLVYLTSERPSEIVLYPIKEGGTTYCQNVSLRL